MSGTIFDTYFYYNCNETAFQNKHVAHKKDKVVFKKLLSSPGNNKRL